MVTPYSQRDTEWSYDGLGHKAAPTMGEAGCLVTVMASIVTDLGNESISPGYLNGWLRENGGFANGNLFVFASIAPLGLRVAEMVRRQGNTLPIDGLIKALEEGAAIVAQVDARPGGTRNEHWVRILELDEKDGRVMDPWQLPGKELAPLSTYFSRGWTPGRALFMAAVYRPAAATRWPGSLTEDLPPGIEEGATEALAAAHQPALCLRKIEAPS